MLKTTRRRLSPLLSSPPSPSNSSGLVRSDPSFLPSPKMADPKDSGIKLFGRTIPIPEDPPPAPYGAHPSAVSAVSVAEFDDDDDDDGDLEQDRLSSPDGDGVEEVDDKETLGVEQIDNKQEDGTLPEISEEFIKPEGPSGTNENPKTTSSGKESVPLKTANTDAGESETSTSQEKTLKKPDKILPCPRCNSMDTKFCYYNNYNVNQPRHFCKNCQRYWTAGGTMRNVPVGAGRRKNKNSASHYHHITVPEALQTALPDIPNVVHHPVLKSNGTVLTFGSDTPLCESMASALNLAEKTMHNCTQNGFHKPEERNIPVSYRGRENGGEGPSGSSVTSSTSMDEARRNVSREPMMHNFPGGPPQIPGFPGGPWPYPWNPAHWSSPIPPPAFCPPGFPMPFYPPAAYWGCTVPGPWNVTWLPQLPLSPNQSAPSSGPNSPTLGKHSRDENMPKTSNSGEEEPLKENNSERSLWIPKTLRIDDPSEAARSSLWATLGINNDKADSIKGGKLFKAFQSKSDQKNYIPKTSSVLQANPAALSRSLNFQESS